MIRNYAVIDPSGNVTNVIAWDGVTKYIEPSGYSLVETNSAGIGWTYSNGTFTNPNQGD